MQTVLLNLGLSEQWADSVVCDVRWLFSNNHAAVQPGMQFCFESSGLFS